MFLIYFGFMWFTLIENGICSERIIGGTDAVTEAFPYQVALEIGGSLYCGGSIIGDSWVLTAAHCLRGIHPQQMRVVAGTIVLHNGTGQVYEIQEFRLHENYNAKEIRNDIGIIKLKNCLSFNNNIMSIPVATEEVGGGKTLTLTGWGKTQFPGNSTTKLQKIELVSVSDSECAKIYSQQVDNRNLCTEGIPGRGACKGDSGGPLVFGGSQVGIVSWGIACAKGKPDVFTDVYSFRGWIEEHIKQ